MELKDAIRLALSTSIIDDPSEVEALLQCLNEVKLNTPYLEYLPSSLDEIPFRNEFAYVPTKSSDAGTPRIIRSSDGRKTFTLPILRLETPFVFSIVNPEVRRDLQSESGIFGNVAECKRTIYEDIPKQLYSRIFSGLSFVAESEGRVVYTDPGRVTADVADAVAKIDSPSSVLVHPEYARKISDDRLKQTVAVDGKIRDSFDMAKEEILVVPDMPQKVGFVRINAEPRIFLAPSRPGQIQCSAIGEYGFCFWSDSQVTKFVIRK